MNSKQAKSIPLIAFLQKLGFTPDHVKQNGVDYWYTSPFRSDEKTPSFHINKIKNVWFDFGNSQGGNLIDFVLLYKNCTMPNALNFIESTYTNAPKTVVQAQKKILATQVADSGETFTLNEIKRDFALSLSRYISETRKINFNAIQEFIVQIHFSNREGKHYFGIGMKNLSDGYEIRNPYFKGNVGKKDLTFVKGTGNDSIAIFEGMFNFFSAITHFGKANFMQNDILILNSISFQEQAISYLKDRPQYKKLSLFLDNDAAGQEATEKFKTQFPDKLIEPSFALYLSHNDFNDFLIARSQYKTK